MKVDFNNNDNSSFSPAANLDIKHQVVQWRSEVDKRKRLLQLITRRTDNPLYNESLYNESLYIANKCSVLIFGGTRVAAVKLAEYLTNHGLWASYIIGGMPRYEKYNLLNGMQHAVRVSHNTAAITMTDYTAQHLNMSKVDMIVQYELVPNLKTFEFRLGLLNNPGVMVSFADARNASRLVHYMQSSCYDAPIPTWLCKLAGISPPSIVKRKAPESDNSNRNAVKSNDTDSVDTKSKIRATIIASPPLKRIKLEPGVPPTPTNNSQNCLLRQVKIEVIELD